MRGHALLNFENLSVERVGPGNLSSTDGLTAQAREILAARETGVHAAFPWFLGVQHRMANFISVGFTYKHADGNLTRITRQLSVPAPFQNKSESMAHLQNKYVGCWCIVRQAQMQP